MLHNGLLNLLSAQRVLGTVVPIIRSSILYRWIQHVAHNTVKMEHLCYWGVALWKLC